jgi:oligopeptide transport system ATP-binding protein
LADTRDTLIEIDHLKKYFSVKSGFHKNYVHAVEDVSLFIKKGETLGLVGESGCGKTTLGRTLLRLYEPTEGVIRYNGTDITRVNMLPYRRKMQIIFQDPSASLDPRMTVGEIVGEAIDIHKLAKTKSVRRDKIIYYLERVGLNRRSAAAHRHRPRAGR